MNNPYFDFKCESDLASRFAGDYLRQYYQPERDITDDELAVCRFVQRVGRLLPRGAHCVELGCGPTVHHAILLAPFVQSLTLADYLPENLREVERWVGGVDDAWNWNHYTRRYLLESGRAATPEDVAAVEALARARIRGTVPCDLTKDPPCSTASGRFDLVAAFYCLEEVAMTPDSFRRVLKNITGLLAPGGAVLVACLENTDHYQIRREDGTTMALPCLPLTRHAFLQSLSDAGFDASSALVERVGTPTQAQEGVPGVLLALAGRACE